MALNRREFLKLLGLSGVAVALHSNQVEWLHNFLKAEAQGLTPPSEYFASIIEGQQDIEYLSAAYEVLSADERNRQAMISWEKPFSVSLPREAQDFARDRYMDDLPRTQLGQTYNIEQLPVEDGEWAPTSDFFERYQEHPDALVIAKMMRREEDNTAITIPNFHLMIGHSYYDNNQQPLLLEWLRSMVYRYAINNDTHMNGLLGLPLTFTQEGERFITELHLTLSDIKVAAEEPYNASFSQATQTIFSGAMQPTPDQKRVVAIPAELGLTPPPEGQIGLVLVTCFSPAKNLHTTTNLFSHRILAQFTLAESIVTDKQADAEALPLVTDYPASEA